KYLPERGRLFQTSRRSQTTASSQPVRFYVWWTDHQGQDVFLRRLRRFSTNTKESRFFDDPDNGAENRNINGGCSQSVDRDGLSRWHSDPDDCFCAESAKRIAGAADRGRIEQFLGACP